MRMVKRLFSLLREPAAFPPWAPDLLGQVDLLTDAWAFHAPRRGYTDAYFVAPKPGLQNPPFTGRVALVVGRAGPRTLSVLTCTSDCMVVPGVVPEEQVRALTNLPTLVARAPVTEPLPQAAE